MRKTGQAAIEFLTTYGWALFILFAVVSAVYMLDLGDPDRYAEPECTLDQQITCLESTYDLSSEELKLNLQNNYPKDITITETVVELQGSDKKSNTTMTVSLPSSSSKIINHTTPNWGGKGYITESVAAQLDITVEFEVDASGNRYNKTGFTVVRAR